MIARIFIFIILATILPDVYVYRRYLRRRFDLAAWQRLLWWLPGAAMIAATLMYTMIDNFAPDNLTWFNIYLFMLGLIVVPKLLFVVSSLVGRLVRRVFHLHRNWGNYIGLVIVLGELYVLFTGSMLGPDRLRVNEVTLEFNDLPQAFDGYRIVQFSDAHLGSMRTELLSRAVDEINSQRPDMIVFTGDLQNMRPQELTRHAPVLARLHSRDGIYSVLGNHDYSEYLPSLPETTKRAYERQTRSFETSIDWNLLLTDYHILVEQRTAKGRTDMTIETKTHIFIIEMKFGRTAEEALAQINKAKYADAFALKGKQIVKVGINFNVKEERNITEWVVE